MLPGKLIGALVNSVGWATGTGASPQGMKLSYRQQSSGNLVNWGGAVLCPSLVCFRPLAWLISRGVVLIWDRAGALFCLGPDMVQAVSLVC